MIDVMEGITILNTIENEVRVWGINWGVIVFGILVIIGVIIFLIGIFAKENDLINIGLIFMLVNAFIIVIAGSRSKLVSTYNTYEVSIDETVNMKEFIDKYDIVDRRMDILEIKERDIDNGNN